MTTIKPAKAPTQFIFLLISPNFMFILKIAHSHTAGNTIHHTIFKQMYIWNFCDLF